MLATTLRYLCHRHTGALTSVINIDVARLMNLRRIKLMVFMVWIVCFQHWFGLDCNLYEREMVYIEVGTDTSDKFGRTVLD